MQHVFSIIDLVSLKWSLNEGWHIYKIAEPVIFTGVVFLALASSDLAIDPRFSW